MGNNKMQLKLKQANRKYKHDLKRRRKAFAEKKRIVNALEHNSRRKNNRRRAEAAYVASLGAELQ